MKYYFGLTTRILSVLPEQYTSSTDNPCRGGKRTNPTLNKNKHNFFLLNIYWSNLNLFYRKLLSFKLHGNSLNHNEQKVFKNQADRLTDRETEIKTTVPMISPGGNLNNFSLTRYFMSVARLHTIVLFDWSSRGPCLSWYTQGHLHIQRTRASPGWASMN